VDYVKKLKEIAETNTKFNVLEQLVFAPTFRILISDIHSSIDTKQKQDIVKRAINRVIDSIKKEDPRTSMMALQIALLKVIDSSIETVDKPKETTKEYIQ